MKAKIIRVRFVCPMCGKEHCLNNVPKDLVERVHRRRETGEFIQDILGSYSRFDREKFMTGYCDECQERLFGCKRTDRI